MKKTPTSIKWTMLCLLFSLYLQAQIGTNSTGTASDSSAMLDVSSNSKIFSVSNSSIIDVSSAGEIMSAASNRPLANFIY